MQLQTIRPGCEGTPPPVWAGWHRVLPQWVTIAAGRDGAPVTATGAPSRW